MVQVDQSEMKRLVAEGRTQRLVMYRPAPHVDSGEVSGWILTAQLQTGEEVVLRTVKGGVREVADMNAMHRIVEEVVGSYHVPVHVEWSKSK